MLNSYFPRKDGLSWLCRRWTRVKLAGLALVLFSIGAAARLDANVVIDFENLNAPGNGTAGLQVGNQYAAEGVTFNFPAALDYSQGVPVLPNFAHSGTKAVELCRGAEFCVTPLQMTFNQEQGHVKVWVGYSAALPSAQTVVLIAYDLVGNELGSATATLGPSTDVIPIATPLEFSMLPYAKIGKATVGFLGAESSPAQMFNNNLAVDDVEFDSAGPPPSCPSAQPPSLTVNTPEDGKVLVVNSFDFDATVGTSDPFATMKLDVTAGANSHSYGPFYIKAGEVALSGLTDFLFPGDNTLTVTVTDCAGSTQVSRTLHYRTDVTSTRIRVIDENNQVVPSAEVYVNGIFRGLTDQVGQLTVSPALPDGTPLVARKLVEESKTYRGNHSVGSYQDWKYRVYITSLAVNDDGSTPAQPVVLEPDPTATQVLQIFRKNTLIGIHVVASLEWDANDAELEDVKSRFLRASPFLYNATDGQVVFEQVEIVDDSTFWEDADYRIYANFSLRSNVDNPLGGFFDDSFWTDGSWIHIPRAEVPGNNTWFGDPRTYVHEFGHYGWGLHDEYKDGHGEIHCTALITAGSGPFGSGGGKAACVMFNQGPASKYCSTRPENPHVSGTEQGDDSCWHDIVDRLKDNPFLSPARWIMQSPETRGAIPGRLSGPLAGWAPLITIHNHARPNLLCQPLTVVALNGDGTPMTKQQIWLLTTYGAQILEGETDGRGELTATGIHVGDQLGFAGWIGVSAGLSYYMVRDSDCTPVTAALIRPAAPLANPALPNALALVANAAAFNLFVSLEPTPNLGEVLVRISVQSLAGSQPVKLAAPPTVQFAFSGQGTSQPLALQFDSRSKTYSGVIHGAKPDAEVSFVVSATDTANHTVTRTESFGLTGIDPAASTTVYSIDGALSLTIPPGGAPVGDSAGIGPSPVKPPSLPPGFGLVVGPFKVLISSGEQLLVPGSLRFQLPRLVDLPGASGFDAKTFHILRYDAAKGSWSDVGPGVFLAPPLEKVTLQTQQLGIYALIAHLAPPAADGGPDVSGATATVPELWPPNHELVKVGVTGVTSANGPVSIVIDRITSDEPTQSTRPGDLCPDAINDGSTAELRAERLAQGTGRVYTLFFTASDSSGHANSGQVKVCVPLNQSDDICLEGTPAFDATVCQ